MPTYGVTRSWLPLVVTFVLTACSGDSPGPSGPNNTGPTLEINGTKTAEVGQTVQLGVIAKDANGAPQAPGAVSWSSSDQTLISVGTDGVVTPLRIGSVIITATAGSASATATFTSTLSPYTFVFPAGVSASEQQLIRDAIQDAHAFQKAAFNRSIQQATTVTGALSAQGCASGGAAAFTGAGAVTFCLTNVGWTTHGVIIKQKVVHHELFHVWQFETGWISNPATAGSTWIIEGSAELVGFRGIEARNLLPFATALGCQVKESADFASKTPPGLPPLSQVEGRQAFQNTVGPLYTHSMLAMDRLVGSGSLKVLETYGLAVATGAGWPTAFNGAFGKAPAAFYSEFYNYLDGLQVPASYQCRV